MLHAQGPKIVLTRICVAMSGFIIHSAPDHWRDPITDIINMFSPQVSASDCDDDYDADVSAGGGGAQHAVPHAAAGAAHRHPRGVPDAHPLLHPQNCRQTHLCRRWGAFSLNVAIIKPTTSCFRTEPSSPLPPERYLSPQPAPGGQPRGRAAGEMIGLYRQLI